MKIFVKAAVIIALLPFSFLANARDEAQPILVKTRDALGLEGWKKPVLHFFYNDAALGREQSDRPYPPFFTTSINAEAWYDPKINATYVRQTSIRAGSGPSLAFTTIIKAPGKAYFVRDTLSRAFNSEYDKLNAWAVVLDWLHDPAVTRGKDQDYRDYPRIVLERNRSGRKERLFIDPKTWFPVKLDWEEPHSLWGQQLIEIVYSNWTALGESSFAVSAFRLEDGQPMVYRAYGKSNFSDTAGLFDRFARLPENVGPVYNQEVYVSEQPKLVKVSDQVYLLQAPLYTETITSIGDTVYLFDATLSEERARQDEALIRQTFPNARKTVVVVTDVAWPHIGGVRYWVSKGATILSHPANKPFLDRIVSRKWTIHPDELQKHPRPMKFVQAGLRKSLSGGNLVIFPIDGIGSECALACYLKQDGFLWCSDYVQNTRIATAYAKEVIAAVKREQLEPRTMAAEHVPLTDWQQVVAANK